MKHIWKTLVEAEVEAEENAGTEVTKEDEKQEVKAGNSKSDKDFAENIAEQLHQKAKVLEGFKSRLKEIKGLNYKGNLQQQFNQIVDAIMVNASPKSIVVSASDSEKVSYTKPNEIRINKDGWLVSTGYYSRPGKISFTRLLDFYKKEEEFEELIDETVAALVGEKFRTAKRTKKKLERLKRFVKSNWDTIKKLSEDSNFEQMVDVGKVTMYSPRRDWGDQGEGRWHQCEAELVFGSNQVLLRSKKQNEARGGYSGERFTNRYEAIKDLQHLVGFISILDNFEKYVDTAQTMQKTQMGDVNKLLDEFKDEFAREVVISKTKQIAKGV